MSVTCPDCRGEGLSRALVMRTGGCVWETQNCRRCEGARVVDESVIAAIEEGRRVRDVRIARYEAQGVVARRLGISVVEYSGYENGRLKGDQLKRVRAAVAADATSPPPVASQEEASINDPLRGRENGGTIEES